MSTEAINRGRDTVSSADRDERAQKAVKVFRGMQFGLSAYARAVTGNKKVRIEISGGIPHTDGTVIYYRPPIALGDKTPHNRFYCDKRDADGLQVCPACKVREEVLVNIYHEIAHIAFNSFAQTSEKAKHDAIDLAIKEWGGQYAELIRKKLANVDPRLTRSYMGLSNIISPFLPLLLNCLDDARVDSSMFRARKGTKKMLEADTFSLLRDGIPQANGDMAHHSEAPLNAQAALACYLQGAGYVGWETYLHEKIGFDFKDELLTSLLAKIVKTSTVAEVYNLAFPIMARLRELGYFQLPEDEPEPQPEDQDEDNEEQSDEPSEEPNDSDDESEDEDGPDSADSGQPEDEDGSSDGADASDSDDGGEADASDDTGVGEDQGGESSASDPADEAAQPSDGDVEDGADGDGEPGEGDASDSLDDASDNAVSGSGDAGDAGEAGQPEGSDPADGGGDGQDEGTPSEGGAGEGAPEGGEPSATEPEGVDLTDGADQDEVPSEAGSPGVDAGDGEDASGDAGDGTQVGEGSAGEAESDSSDGEPDAAGQGGSSGGDQSQRGDVGEDLGDDTGERPDQSNGESSDQLDDGTGDGEAGEGSEQGSGPGYEGFSPDAPDGDSPSDEHSGDRAEPEGDRPDSDDGTPEGVLESGADEGLGGVEVIEDEAHNYGDADDVEAALQHAHGHSDLSAGDTVQAADTALDEKAIALAIVQGIYFETPSLGVSNVEEHTYGPGAHGWVTDKTDLEHKVYYGIWQGECGEHCKMEHCDHCHRTIVIPEKVLGPALLKVRKIFDENKAAAYQQNLRSGRVNSKVLGKRAWSDDNRLFGKKRLPAKKDYAVMIALDVSSSNLGDNLLLLKRSVMAQAELLQRAGVPFAIVAHSCGSRFGSGGYTMHLHHVKDWDEPWDSNIQVRLFDLTGVGGNLDGHAMEYMRKSLVTRDVTDKILLYYTDGKMPAANSDEELEVLQRQIKLCKRDQITLLGVGIRTDSPVRHGLDTVQVDSDDDLPRVVEHLGKRLQRSAR